MAATRLFTPLMIVVGLAFAVPVALSRLKRVRLPIVVGEILTGIVVGRSGFGWVTDQDLLLNLLSELGFVFLMFLAGMEVDLSTFSFMQVRKPCRFRGLSGPLPLGVISFFLTLASSTLIGFILRRFEMIRDPWMMALILSTTSLGVVVPVLKERGLSSGRLGQTILLAALIADFVTMFLITLKVAVVSRGVASRILVIGVLFGAVFLVARLGVIMNRIKAVRRTLEELSHATAQIKVRAAFAMMLVFVALSEVLGTEVILGAFMAGSIVAMLGAPQDERLLHQLEGIGYGFFIPVFFIMVGADFNMPVLFHSQGALWIVPILLLAALAVKALPALVFRLSFSWREALASGVLLSSRLSLIIAAVSIGSRLGLIGEAVNSAVLLVAVVTVTAAPPIFLRLVPGRDPTVQRPIIVVGAGELGLQVAEQLRRHHEQVVVVDSHQSRVERARQHGFTGIVAAVDRFDESLAPYLDEAQALVCTHTDANHSHRICQFVRTHYGIDNIVTQVPDPRELTRFRQLGVLTMNSALSRAAILTLLVRNPGFYALLSGADGDKEVLEAAVQNSQLVGRALRDLTLPGDVLVLALRRHGELLVPHGDTRLEQDDRLTLVGSLDAVQAARLVFSRPADDAAAEVSFLRS